MSKLIQVKFTNISDIDIERKKYHTEENLKTVILQNYYLFNSTARSGIADILYEEYKKNLKQNPDHISALHCIFLEIYSKFIQVSEDLSLICLMLLNTRSVIETYMNSNSSHTFSFYSDAHKGFTKSQIIKMFGYERIYTYIRDHSSLSKSEKENINKLLNEDLEIQNSNLKIIGKIYIDDNYLNQTKKYIQGGPIDVFNSIKHGYKVVYPTKLGKKIWPEINDNSVDVMHRIIEDIDNKSRFIGIGGFQSVSEELVTSIMHNISFYSSTLKDICETTLLSESNPYYFLQRLRLAVTEYKIKEGNILKSFNTCLCGSQKKYKQCCLKFKNQYENDNLVEIMGI